MNNLSKRLKELRIKNNYSQTDIANYLNISRQSVSKWEAGKTTPDLDNLILLAELYNLSIDSLITGNTPQDIPESSNHQNLLEKSLPVLEMLGLSIILVLSTNFPFGGILVSIIVAVWLKRSNRNYKLIYGLCLICFILSLSDAMAIYTHLNSNYGSPIIEPVN